MTNPCEKCSAPHEEVKGSRARRRADLGKELGSGGNKIAFEFKSGAIAVLKTKERDEIVTEMSLLSKLRENNLPTPTVIGPLHIEAFAEKNLTSDGPRCRPGIEFEERFAHGSKQVVRLEKGKITASRQALSITQNSVQILQNIRAQLVNQKIKIDDLQFLVRTDGSVVIADPLNVRIGEKPSKTSLAIIDKLIGVAKAQP